MHTDGSTFSQEPLERKGTVLRYRKHVAVIAALAAVSYGVLGAAHLGAQSATSWPTFGGSGLRTGTSTVSGTRSGTLANTWQLSNKAIVGSPVVDSNGTAYVGADDGNVYAVSPSNPAAPLWSFSTHGPVESTPSLSPDGKTLYVGSNDGSVYAIATATGKQTWSRDLAGEIRGSPLVSSDGGTVYVSNVNGTIDALSATDGSVVWSNPLSGAVPASLTMSADNGSLYAATSTGYMYGIPTSGSSAGSASQPFYLDVGSVATPSVDQNGNIYVATTNGVLDQFSPSQGAATWKFEEATHTAASTTAAITNGLVVFAGGDGNLYGLNPSTGTPIWTDRNLSLARSSPVIATGNSTIYVGSESGIVYAFDANGNQIWAHPTGAAISSSPALGPDGSVWIANQAGSIFRFHDISVPSPPSTVPPASTATAVPTATQLPATATPVTTATSVATATLTPPVLSFTRKSSVAAGKRQFLTIHAAPGTVVHIRVNYPNGDHQSHKGKTNSSGVLKYSYVQANSKITHSKFNATIQVKANGATVKKPYKIKYGPIDVSVEPRSVKTGHRINLYVHTRAHTKINVRIVSPNGKNTLIQEVSGPKGWGLKSYTVPKTFLRAKKSTRLDVLAQTASGHPTLATKTFLTLKP
jgi:outer membrane protein assembly factor BamB